MRTGKNLFWSLLSLGILTLLNQTICAQPKAVRVEDVTKWLTNNAILLRHVEVGNGFADLDPLKKVLQGVRIVGLGEATHGTSEFFKFKHRILEFLVKEMNFRVLAIETGYAATADINEYLVGKSNDGAKALEKQGFWPLDTAEMLTILKWMRAYNANVPTEKKLTVAGFDIHYNNEAKPKILLYLKRVAPNRVADTEALFGIDLEKLLERAFFTKSAQERSDIVAKLAQARAKYNELLGFLTLNEVRFTNQTSAAEFNRIREYARVLAQLGDSSAQPLAEADGPLRDYYMAENIKRLVDAERPGTGVIIWAHNLHVSTGQESEKYQHTGFHLRHFFGQAYYAIGFSFNHGLFQARNLDPKSNKELMQFTVTPAPEGSVDWYLAQAGLKNYLIDLRNSPKNETVERWLDVPHPMRTIGSYYNAQTEQNYFVPTILRREFDGLVFFDQTSSAHPNPSVKKTVGGK